MSEYICTNCGRNTRLPDFCCGKPMTLKSSSSRDNSREEE